MHLNQVIDTIESVLKSELRPFFFVANYDEIEDRFEVPISIARVLRIAVVAAHTDKGPFNVIVEDKYAESKSRLVLWEVFDDSDLSILVDILTRIVRTRSNDINIPEKPTPAF